MKSMENSFIRRQVPESDPEYLIKREQGKNSRRQETFASSGVSVYERQTNTYENITQNRERLQSFLLEYKDSPETVMSLEESIKTNEKNAKDILENRADYLRDDFKILAKNLYRLELQPISQERKQYVYDLVLNIFNSKETIAELKEIFNNEVQNFNLNHIVKSIMMDSFSGELLYSVAKKHIENIKKQEVFLKEFVLQTKNEFKQKIKEEVDKNFLPKEVLDIISRVDTIDVVISDMLVNMNSSTLGSIDFYGKILIDSEQLREGKLQSLKRTLFHEFLHEISGKSITLIKDINDSGEEEIHAFTRKLGMVLHNPTSSYSPNKWLNEAITEWLALRFSNYQGDTTKDSYKGSLAYVSERKELDRLFEKGLEENLVLRAYFENFSSEQDKKEKGKYYAQLIKRINELEGKEGFSAIENKHVMSELLGVLNDNYIYEEETFKNFSSVFSEGTERFKLSVIVGHGKFSQIVKEFVFFAQPITEGKEIISPENQWKKKKEFLAYIESNYKGKVTIITDTE